MTQERDPKEVGEAVANEATETLPIFAYWEGETFEDPLDIPLDRPYSSAEWDSIFQTFINLLNHEERWIRQAAIARLKRALDSESSQFSNCEDYQPQLITERIKTIFDAITVQAVKIPNLLEDFYALFKSIFDRESYLNLIRQWLNLSIKTENPQLSDEAIVIVEKFIFSQNLNSALKPIFNEFEIAIDRINGYLDGLSTLCHGLNYVPIYQAILCPQIINEISIDIQATLLTKSSDYKDSISRLKSSSECRDFEKINDWEKALNDSVERWIFKRMFQENIQDDRHQNSAKNSTTHQLVNLIHEAIDFNKLEVWRFQIARGCDYIWGFDHESYAFKANDRLFIIMFGWAD